MTDDVDSIENQLLDALASTMETIRTTDLDIRESIDARQWNTARRLSARLVDFLIGTAVSCGELRRQSIGLNDGRTEHAIQFYRCSDMSTYVLGVVSKYLPIYRRIVAALEQKAAASTTLWN